MWNKIHKRDTILQHAPWVIIGTVDTGSKLDDTLAKFNAKNAKLVADNKAKATYSLEEVQKHNKENDAWVTIQGDVAARTPLRIAADCPHWLSCPSRRSPETSLLNSARRSTVASLLQSSTKIISRTWQAAATA